MFDYRKSSSGIEKNTAEFGVVAKWGIAYTWELWWEGALLIPGNYGGKISLMRSLET